MALNSVFPRGYEAFLAGTSGAAFARELGVDSGDAGSYWVLRDGGMDGFRAAMRMTVSLDRKLEAAGRTRAELEEWLEDFLRG